MKKSHNYFKLTYLFLLVLAIMVFIGPISREFKFKKLSITAQDYLLFDFFLEYHSKIQNKSVTISNLALENIYNFSYGIVDFPEINQEIDKLWENTDYYDNNSHEFYAHSLTILWHFLLAHKETNDIRYLEQGNEVIVSWVKANNRFDPSLSKYAWSDHSTAKRTIAILFFLDYYTNYIEIDKDLFSIYEGYVNDALQYLSNSSNYSFPHNHGIYQDIALFFIGIHLTDLSLQAKYFKLASDRFAKQVDKGFSKNGFHLENSPGYHFLTILKCREFMELSGNYYKINPETKKIVEIAEQNKRILYFNDILVSPIGDTEMVIGDSIKHDETSLFAVDSLAGYTLYSDPINTLQIRTNGVYNTHSHNDALSILYSTKDGIIFTETGFLDYTVNERNNFTKSLQAHNSLLPQDLLGNYTVNHQSRLSEFANSEDVIYFQFNAENIDKIKRKIVFNKNDNCLFIWDFISMERYDDWLRLFNLDIEAEFEIIDDYSIRLFLNDCEYYIQSHTNPIRIKNGSSVPMLGWNTDRCSTLEPSNIIIENTRSKVNLLTISKDAQMIVSKCDDSTINYKKLNIQNSIKIDSERIFVNNIHAAINKYQHKPIDLLNRKKIISYKRRLDFFAIYFVVLFLSYTMFHIIMRLKKKILNVLIISTTIIFSFSLFIYTISNFTY